jgi:hypothetical protein
VQESMSASTLYCAPQLHLTPGLTVELDGSLRIVLDQYAFGRKTAS